MVSHDVVNPTTIKLLSLLFHDSNFATVMNYNIKYWCFLIVFGNPCERVFLPHYNKHIGDRELGKIEKWSSKCTLDRSRTGNALMVTGVRGC